MTPDDPTIVAVGVVHTAASVERNGLEWWVRIWCGEHSILVHPDEAALFAAQIRTAECRARLGGKEATP